MPGKSRTIPSGAWRLIVLEFWERFSYYGILAILVLFLTSPERVGGFGWTDSHALDLLSKFTAAAFMLPTVGGYVADRWLGARLAVLIGSCLLVVGNVVIAASALWLERASLRASATGAEWALYAGLVCVALGNGFFKSSLITLLGNLIPDDDVARDRAFRYYYQSIMLGALAAALCVGFLAEAAGWWSGFAFAALGMAISWAIFLIGPASFPAPHHGITRASAALPAMPDGPSQSCAVPDIAILCAFLPIITIGWVQFQGLWLIEMDRSVDRTVGAFTVPAPWLLAVNAIAIVLLAPVAGRMWRRLARRGESVPGFTAQLASAFAIMGCAHLLMAVGFRNAVPGGVSLLWPVGCLLMITAAEAIFWPSSYNAIHRIAPPRLKSMVMGIWLAMLGLGQYFTHQVARLAEVLGFSALSVCIGVAMLLSCIVLGVVARLRPALRAV